MKDRNSGKPKLTARNWECGVVVLAATGDRGEDSSAGTGGAAENFDIFNGVVPVPMEYPALPYQGNARQPWFVGEA